MVGARRFAKKRFADDVGRLSSGGRFASPIHTMNNAHRFLAEYRDQVASRQQPPPQSSTTAVRMAIAGGRERMQQYAYTFSPSSSPEPSKSRLLKKSFTSSSLSS